MNNDEHRPHKDEANDSTADSLQSRDSPESTTPQKTDSRDNASHTQRTQLGTGSSTRTDATESDNTVRACPECDTTAVEARSTDKLRGRPADEHYACRHCGATFDEPIQRDRQATPGDPGYLAGKLAKADPDDVSADHVGEPMTDGGAVMNDASAADLVADVLNGSDAALTTDEHRKLSMVEEHLLTGEESTERITDTRIEAAAKLRTLADNLERAARHSVADDVEVSLHVSVEETVCGSWGED
ncbi:hypothetical protein [Haloarcula sebkhae]|uniref:Uncharacterized protein n=2 Tax=Haloarcula sebkhae TaxID=932660 RepID=A0ACC6VIG6_9EURY|nr:hypothetical protein [Haloarcula sebkhae]GGK74337.1 hypothetical protein GCM10009067_28150 [Haloarcula sebkhae]